MVPNLVDIFNSESDSDCLTSSSYFDIEQFGNYIKKFKLTDLSVYNNNARSLVKNKSQYDIFFETLRQVHNFEFDIISFDETWLCKELEDLVVFNGYTSVFKHKAPQKEGGGLAIFVKNNIDFIIRDDILIPDHLHNIFDSITIEIQMPKKNIILSLVYRSPSHDSINDVTNYVLEFLKKFEGKQVILLGDLNINLLNIQSHPQTTHFFDSLISGNMIPQITIPTRITQTSATLIDHIFSNNIDNTAAGTILTDISDHYSNFIFIKVTEKF
jgi:hypothetical protein